MKVPFIFQYTEMQHTVKRERSVDVKIHGNVTVTVNLPAIVRELGLKALRSKTGRATALRGMVKVHVSSRVRDSRP